MFFLNKKKEINTKLIFLFITKIQEIKLIKFSDIKKVILLKLKLFLHQ